MRISTATLAAASAASGLIAAACFWWWARLVTDLMRLSGSLPSGMDCRHDPQMHAALGFAALAIALLLGAMGQALSKRKTKNGVV